jgi:cysteine desulfurase
MDPAGPIYLDHNASTPVHPTVREAVVRAMDEGFGNPSAEHAYGRRARAIVEEARAEVAGLLGCAPGEIVFTGGGTEASNLALRGAGARALVITVVEHPATAEPARRLREAGVAVVEVPVGAGGAVDPDGVDRALSGLVLHGEGPVMVSVILAQNETGVIQPLAEIAARARARGALVHADAAQAVGKITVDVRALGVDLLSVAGHKLYAPKGVGALYVRRGVPLGPLVVGAGHERGIRPGTENVPGIAGLGAACALARRDLEAEAARQRSLRDRLEALLGEAGLTVHGASSERLPNTINGHFPGVRGAALLARVPEVAFTTGSACHAGEEHPSRTLLAMGIPAGDALGAIRLTLGRGTTVAAIDRAAALLVAGARALAA